MDQLNESNKDKSLNQKAIIIEQDQLEIGFSPTYVEFKQDGEQEIRIIKGLILHEISIS